MRQSGTPIDYSFFLIFTLSDFQCFGCGNNCIYCKCGTLLVFSLGSPAGMPTNVPRIQITPSCQSHADLLNYWSAIEGRSISSLCSALLEEAILGAIESGRANPIAVSMMENLMNERKEQLKISYGYAISAERKKVEVQEKEREKYLERTGEGPDYDELEEAKESSDSYWKTFDRFPPPYWKRDRTSASDSTEHSEKLLKAIFQMDESINESRALRDDLMPQMKILRDLSRKTSTGKKKINPDEMLQL